MTGASNLTGFCPDLAGLAARCHAAGALLFVAAARLAPHRRWSRPSGWCCARWPAR